MSIVVLVIVKKCHIGNGLAIAGIIISVLKVLLTVALVVGIVKLIGSKEIL